MADLPILIKRWQKTFQSLEQNNHQAFTRMSQSFLGGKPINSWGELIRELFGRGRLPSPPNDIAAVKEMLDMIGAPGYYCDPDGVSITNTTSTSIMIPSTQSISLTQVPSNTGTEIFTVDIADKISANMRDFLLSRTETCTMKDFINSISQQDYPNLYKLLQVAKFQLH